MLKPTYHFFRTDIAEQYGIPAAILLEHIRYWTDKNKANGAHFYDGRYWTYNSVKAFTELFPYFSEKQVRGHLTRLVDEGLILKGNYNASAYDRTAWYTLTDKGEGLYDITRSVNIDLRVRANGSPRKGEPIPDIDTDIYIPGAMLPSNVSDKAYNPNTPSPNILQREEGSIRTSPLTGGAAAARVPYEQIKNDYNAICASLPKCKVLTEERKRAIKARFAEGFTAEMFREVFRKAEQSSFLKGGGKQGFVANLDFLIGAKAAKVLEGVYDDGTGAQAEETPLVRTPEYTDEEFDRMFAVRKENGDA